MKKTLGERIKERRKEMGLSQEELAGVLFIKQATLSKYEKGSRDIPSSILLSISRELKTTPDYLLLGENEDDCFIEELINAGRRLKNSSVKNVAINQIKALVDMEADISNNPNIYKKT